MSANVSITTITSVSIGLVYNSLLACPRSQWRKKNFVETFFEVYLLGVHSHPPYETTSKEKIDRPERGHDPSTWSVESLRPNRIQMDVAASALVEV